MAEVASAVPIQEVCLERLRFAVRRHLSDHMVANAVDAIAFVDMASQHTVLELRATVLGEKVDTRQVRYPADWWQAFKARWFPRRWLKRWPVRYTTEQMDLWAAYPRISLPKEQHFFTVSKT